MADATNPLVGRSVGLTSGHFCWPPTGRNYWPLTLREDVAILRAATSFFAGELDPRNH